MLAVRSPAVRRFHDNTIQPRPVFAPRLLTSYAAAQYIAASKAGLLPAPIVDPNHPEWMEKTGHMTGEEKVAFIVVQKAKYALVTFIPPQSVLTGSKKWAKTAQYVYSAVIMLPSFLRRVKLCLTKADVDRIGTQDSKQFLGGQYFANTWKTEERARYKIKKGNTADFEARIAERIRERIGALPEKREGEKVRSQQGKKRREEEAKIRWEDTDRGVVHEKYDHTHFWKYGGERFFGEVESDRLKSDPNACPVLGKLPCECTPTLEMIENDPVLVTGILYLLNQLHLIH